MRWVEVAQAPPRHVMSLSNGAARAFELSCLHDVVRTGMRFFWLRLRLCVLAKAAHYGLLQRFSLQCAGRGAVL